MKIALLGAGRTGSKVVDILNKSDDFNVTVFTRNGNMTPESFQNHDIVISFLPGNDFLNMIETLVESRIPVVTGSTGFIWPVGLSKRLQKLGVPWITANNFSMGMVLIKQMLETLGSAANIFNDVRFELCETHHTSKLDAPSGTALSWQNWLNQPVDIQSKRTVNVIGEHQITLSTEYETIQLNHSVTDRAIFANGAIWAAEQISKGRVSAGLQDYTNIVTQQLTATSFKQNQKNEDD